MPGHSEDRLTALEALPTLEPPAGLEPRALAAMAAASRRRRHGLAAAAVWIIVLAGAAVLTLRGVDVEVPADSDPSLAASGAQAGDAREVDTPDANEAARGAAGGDSGNAGALLDDPVLNDQRYLALLAEAARLEAMLYQLPPPRRVMRVSTAGTIVGLEDRIALLDAELVRATVESDPPEYRAALLRERVDAMSALVNVRYAQSRAFHF